MEERESSCRLCLYQFNLHHSEAKEYRRERKRMSSLYLLHFYDSHPASQGESKRWKAHVIFVFSNLIDGHPNSQREMKSGKRISSLSSLIIIKIGCKPNLYKTAVCTE
jgi:hypothetical protein